MGIEVTPHPVPGEAPCPAVLEAPVGGAEPDGYALQITGRVTGDATHLEVLHRGVPALSIPVADGRFDASLGTLNLPSGYTLEVVAVGPGGGRVPVARIEGERHALPAAGADGIQPILVTGIGRSGSTWLCWTLGCHPEVHAYWPFGFDVRLCDHWMAELQRLADPPAAIRPLLVGQESASVRALHNPELERWVTHEAVGELAAMARDRVQASYRGLGAPAPSRYFVEKHYPGNRRSELAAEVFPGSREIVLVRDFRDVLCSTGAYVEKLGTPAFGRALGAGDADHVELLRSQAQTLLDHWRAAGDRALMLRYEDLMTEPVNTVARLLAYLGLDEEAAEAMVYTATAEMTRPMSMHLTAPDPAASVGRWRTDLDRGVARRCEDAFGPLFEAFGYTA